MTKAAPASASESTTWRARSGLSAIVDPGHQALAPSVMFPATTDRGPIRSPLTMAARDSTPASTVPHMSRTPVTPFPM